MYSKCFLDDLIHVSRRRSLVVASRSRDFLLASSRLACYEHTTQNINRRFVQWSPEREVAVIFMPAWYLNSMQLFVWMCIHITSKSSLANPSYIFFLVWRHCVLQRCCGSAVTVYPDMAWHDSIKCVNSAAAAPWLFVSGETVWIEVAITCAISIGKQQLWNLSSSEGLVSH